MFSEKLREMRQRKKLSQEKLSEELGVSRQAVQKWETGSSLPNIARLISIARYFDVSIDWLLSMPDRSTTEELRMRRTIAPRYQLMQPWELFSTDLSIEFMQCLDEGKEVEELEDLFIAITKLPDNEFREKFADTIFQFSQNAKQRAEYPYVEPDDHDGIISESTGSTEALGPIDWGDFETKVKGAILGRFCGNVLGLSLECIVYDELVGFLVSTNNYPLHRYINSADTLSEFSKTMEFNIKNQQILDACDVIFDDDINYTILASEIVELYGRGFTSHEVGLCWRSHMPQQAFCTAEKVAYRNLLNGYSPPDSGNYKNPYREWIGALIRCDYYGYINPGEPSLAAEMAWRDCRVSHIKNGIYGGMFVAAAIAAAATLDNILSIIEVALCEIPSRSRLHEALSKVLSWYNNGASHEEIVKWIHSEYDEKNAHNWTHVIPNTMIIVAALLYGNGEFGKSICLAVQSGFDTDCNGATTGSIMGMLVGEEGIPKKWLDPIDGKIGSQVYTMPIVDVDALTDRILSHCDIDL